MKTKWGTLLAVLASVLLLWIGNRTAMQNFPDLEHIYQDSSEVAVVNGILRRQSAAEVIDGITYGQGTNIVFTAEIRGGEQAGKLVTVVQNVDPNSPFQMRQVQQGDRILIHTNATPGEDIPWMMGEYLRTDTLAWMGLLFVAAVIFLGRRQGVFTILSLIFTCLAIFTVLLPAILSGKNIYLWSMLVCGYIIGMTLLLVNGINGKSLCAAIGCSAGVGCAGLLTLGSDRLLQLTGMIDEESLYLKFLIEGETIDLKAIIFASILIGAVGAIMDVAISLASALQELRVANPMISATRLFCAGIRIGRDMMGTMANTLVLAYIGGSMSLTLLLMAYSNSLIALLNREGIVVEILQALVGSFGILLTIPLTALVGAVLYTRSPLPPSVDSLPE